MANESCPCKIKVVDISSDNIISIDLVATEDNLSSVQINTDTQNAIESMSEVIIKKGYSPYISETTNTWFEYDDTLHTFVNTNILAGVEFISTSDIASIWGNAITEE